MTTRKQKNIDKIEFIFLNSPNNTVSEIARNTGLKKHFVSRVIDKLINTKNDKNSNRLR